MGEKRDEARRIKRHPVVAQRECLLDVIAFDKLELSNHSAHIVDISVMGVGIESSQKIEPGLVWFKDRVGGYKNGVLMWNRQDGLRYRSGIMFVSLSREEEQYLQKQVKRSNREKTVQDPEQLITSLLETIKQERNGFNDSSDAGRS